MEFLYLYSDGDENQEPGFIRRLPLAKNSIKPKNGIGEDFSDAVLFLYDYFMISNNPLTEDKSASAFLHSPKEEAYIFAPVLAVIVTEESFSHL